MKLPRNLTSVDRAVYLAAGVGWIAAAALARWKMPARLALAAVGAVVIAEGAAGF